MEVRLSKHRKIGRVPQVRSSLMDQRSHGEPFLAACTHPELLVMYLNNQPITLLPGSPLELASLNQILFNLQHRRQRQTKE